jgi:DNA replication and repair protein RecF
MLLKTLSLLHFKNYTEGNLSFSDGVNCFAGNNGEGKTNLLDAIHYLSLCKSYFHVSDSQNIQYEAPFFVIEGSFSRGDQEEVIYCGLKRNQKKIFKRNRKEYERLADHIGLFPMVMITPNDTGLIMGPGEERRRLIDSIISQYKKTYLDDLIAYNHMLTQRNALLKHFGRSQTFDRASLEVWNEQLAETGTRIYLARKDFLDSYLPIFSKYYRFISEDKEEVGIVYESSLQEASFMELLMHAEQKDRINQYTSVGPHRDDLELTLRGHSVKKAGSQGQQKSFLIGLKLAQFEFMKEQKGMAPLLLLDDVFDKLDSRRVKKLMELVSGGSFGQIFITDTHEPRIMEAFAGIDTPLRIFRVSDGNITVTQEA